MNNSRALNLLGMARRAGKVSLGHDAGVASIKCGEAALCVLSSDSSDRLKTEMTELCSHKSTNCISVSYTMQELAMCMGAKTTAVMTLNDKGFAEKFTQLIREE